MMYKIKKKLKHFYTHGNIAEDFVASRRAKVNKIRSMIRVAFYTHCVMAIIGIVLSILLGNGFAVIAMVLSALVSCGFALLAVGNMKPFKEISGGMDLLFSVMWFILFGAVEHNSAFAACGAVMILCFLVDFTVIFATWCREYMEGLNPLLVRREDYTLLRNFSDDLPPEENVEIPLPPLTSEMRELAKQMSEILHENVKNEKSDESTPQVTR